MSTSINYFKPNRYANDNLLAHEAIDDYEVYDTFDKAREAIIQYILRGESIVWNSFLRNIEENHEEFLRGLRMDNEKGWTIQFIE